MSQSNPSIELTTEGHVAILTMSNPPANTWTKDTLIDWLFPRASQDKFRAVVA